MAGGLLLSVRVLVALFLVRLMALHGAGRLGFLGSIAHLAERPALLLYLSAARKKRWAVHAQPRFADPEAVLAYLSRDTHRVAIFNSCFIRFDDGGVTFRSQIRLHMRSIDQLALAVEIPTANRSWPAGSGTADLPRPHGVQKPSTLAAGLLSEGAAPYTRLPTERRT